MNIEKLIDSKNYNVVKANDLITKTRYELSLVEQKIILRLIQMIEPEDIDFKEYEFSINEFCLLCGIDNQSGANYNYIKDTIQQLHDRSFWIKQPDKSERLLSWISTALIDPGSGIIKIELHKHLKPYLLELKKNFTQYSLSYILAMKSKYSIRLYELLKANIYKTKFTLDIDEFKEILCVGDRYERFYDLKKRIIIPAVDEVKIYTDIYIRYHINTVKKAAKSITFEVENKTMAEQIILRSSKNL